MVAGVVFDVAHDVRLRPVRRGPRPLLGPRLTTVLGGDTANMVIELQQMTAAWEDLAGGGRTVPAEAAARPDAASFGQKEHLGRLMNLHAFPVVRARRPIVAEPSAVDPREVRRELRAAAVEQTFALRLPTRRRLMQQADDRVDDEVSRRVSLRRLAHAEDQAEADQWWQHLCDGHPKFSFSRLLTAFEAGDLPAAVTAVGDRTAHVVLSVDTAEMMVGQREPVGDGRGGFSLAIMSDGRRNKLFVKALCSGIVAAAGHALAVVPGLHAVNVAVVGLTQPTGPAVLALAALPRSAVLPSGKERPVIDDLILAAQRGAVRLVLERATLEDTPRPLNAASPSVSAILDALDG